MEIYRYCYQCKKCKDYWYSPEPDLAKILCCNECGETEKIERKKEESEFNAI